MSLQNLFPALLAFSCVIIPISAISNHPILLIISFDGFRYDYMCRAQTPNLQYLASNGVKAPYMDSQFPTRTFPNHQTMATGLYPGDHGVVDNTIFDPKHNEVLTGFKDQPKFWNYDPNVLPFWIRNEQAGGGRYSGGYTWSGVQVGYGEGGKIFPTYYTKVYIDNTTFEERVDTVMGWITNKDKPANVVFLYSHQPDWASHSFGTEHKNVTEEIRLTDDRVGYLITALKKEDILDKVNILIVSDHGMVEVPKKNTINITALRPPTDYDRYGTTPLLHIKPKVAADKDKIYQEFKELGKKHHFTAYKKEELEYLHYSKNPRIMDILLLVDPEYIFEDWNWGNSPEGITGTHGHFPSLVNMRTTFIAFGPAFKKGYILEKPVSNLDLFPLFCYITGVPEAPNNGSLSNIKDVLNPNFKPR